MNDHLRPPLPGAAKTAPRLLVILLGLLGFVLPAGAGAPGAAGAGSAPRPVVLAAGSAQSGARTARVVRMASRDAAGRDGSGAQSAATSVRHTQTQGLHGPGAAVLSTAAAPSAGRHTTGRGGTGQVVPAGAATGTPHGRAPPSSTGS
ncbi:hypothetical protein ACRYCC_35720 [Actinomadura scrupuli]|uniref:hypothetical protein n=1 Tax=Actinomadura scrupuli TaxID=559629 RepID=UPI003D975CAF